MWAAMLGQLAQTLKRVLRRSIRQVCQGVHHGAQAPQTGQDRDRDRR